MNPKYFKKANEILWGLDYKNLLKIITIYLALFASSTCLRIAPSHPLFIFLAIVATIITAFIIKASREDEIRGYYSSLIFHPLADHIYTASTNREGYKSINDLDPIASIDREGLKTKDQDLIAVLKVKHGFCFNRASQEEIDKILNEWQNILIELHKINIIDSYFFTNSNNRQNLQIFINAEPYTYPTTSSDRHNDTNIQFALDLHQSWYQDFIKSQKFIAQLSFYILIKESNPNKINKPLKHLINKYCPLLFKSLKSINHEDKDQQVKLLNQKINTVSEFCTNFNLNATRLELEELDHFTQYWLNSDQITSNSYLKDAGKFLQNNFKAYPYTKTYRLQELPDLAEKKLWLWDLIQRLACKSSISVMLETRNPQADRRKAETKLKNCIKRPLDTGNKLKLIEENKNIYTKLSERPYSFDLSIHITVYTQSINELKKIDNEIKKPLNGARISGLDRMQINNYFSALPFCTNQLKDADKIFTTLEPASLSLPLIDTRLGTSSGPLLGIALADFKPVYLDEYNRDYFHNRAINFIGDSGSGKTVAAKLAIKRRIHDSQRSFYIIDSTEDGWEFFIDYFAGRKIDIDQSTNSKGEALFTPLVLDTSIDINEHLDKCLDLFALLQNSDNKLNSDEKNFFANFLKEFYSQDIKRSLSDLIYNLEDYSANEIEIKNKWLKIFAPYSKIKNGIYASLLDSTESKISERVVLFTFSKIKTHCAYHDTSIFLISDFLSSRIKRQAKTTLIIDEAWKIFRNSQSGKELLCHLARAGRGLDLGLWTISQKPSDLPPEIHSSASSSLCFQLKERQDRLDMIRYANFNDREEKLINSIQLSKSGNAFFKTTIDSGLVYLPLDPLEEIICSSVRDFSNKRKQIFNEFLLSFQNSQEAALETVKTLIKYAK